jgi:hypothetical protein
MTHLKSIVLMSVAMSLTACSVPHTTSSGFLGLHKEPEIGYMWLKPDSFFSYDIIWTPGLRFNFLPNMKTDEKEGVWIADPGYSLVDNDVSPIGLAATWTPGTPHVKFPNVHAAEKEKNWLPDSGFRFVSNDSLLVEPIPVPIESASTSSSSDGTAVALGIGAAVICAIWDSCRETAVEVGKEAAKDAIVDSITN